MDGGRKKYAACKEMRGGARLVNERVFESVQIFRSHLMSQAIVNSRVRMSIAMSMHIYQLRAPYGAFDHVCLMCMIFDFEIDYIAAKM